MMGWYMNQSGLGRPFNDLTEAEWPVLRALTSDASEKQIAANLNMRPHTLHSRIKSIYRKLDVQGRLPLIQRFNLALSEMRIRIHRANSDTLKWNILEKPGAECKSPAVEVFMGT
jgi:DNA-binding CsgD family transcriptional regulator